MLKKETARCFQTCLALFILIFLAAAESPSKDISRLLDLATFGRVNLSATRVSSLESDGNETGGLNEFFFQRGEDGDMGITVAPCIVESIYGTGTCILESDCDAVCSAACSGYANYDIMSCSGNKCDCWCESLSGCGTCGSNAVDMCELAGSSGTCQNSYMPSLMGSCAWYADTSLCHPSGQICFSCFLAGTKIITVGNF